MLSSKMWDQALFAKRAEADPTMLSGFAQSKGAAQMKLVPAAGDLVSFVWKGHVVMRGVVTAGFQAGTLHQTQHADCFPLAAAARAHAVAVAEYATINITEVLVKEDQPAIAPTGQRTWAKMPAA
jgi:hypothetical protein